MNDNHADRAAQTIRDAWRDRDGIEATPEDHARAFAEALDDAGLLARPANDEVAYYDSLGLLGKGHAARARKVQGGGRRG